MEDDTTTDNLYWMLLQVAFRAKHGLMKFADKHGLTVVQLHTLGVMNPGESVPMSKLSCMLLCDASNVTGIVDHLLSQGYIVRREKPEDRRVKMISLTPAGETLRYQLLKTLSEHELPEFQRLTSAERSNLRAVLTGILQFPATK